MKIPIIATSLLKFGESWNNGINDLIRNVGKKALNEAGINPYEVNLLYIANVFSSKTSGQSLLSSIAFEELGIKNSVCIQNGDASGSVAIQIAADSIISGKSDIVMVIGVEKLSDLKTNEILSLSSELISQEESFIGATIQSQFALITRKYLHDFNIDAKDLSFIPSKNHKNALSNEYAQYRFELSEANINSSPMHSDPIRVFDCASYCDGAAALVMCSENFVKKFKKKIKGYYLAGSFSSDFLSLSRRKSLATIESTVKSAKESFKNACLKPSDIGLIEVHDIVPVSEVIAVEDLGFAKKGKGIQFIKSNLKRINSTGGLKACGHAVGATGVRQAVDIVNRLRISHAKYGLSHTIAGTGGISAVNIFGVG